MEPLFYVGPDHHETHLEFARLALGGRYVRSGHFDDDHNTYAAIAHLDRPDAVWVFADLYKNILPHLKGKVIFLPHGLGFKPFVSEYRARLLNEYVTQIWSTGNLEEEKYRRGAVDIEKIFRVGYGVPFLIPNEPTIPNSVFVSIGWFLETVHWHDMLELLERAPRAANIFYSVHPSMDQEIQDQFHLLEHENMTFVSTEEDMLSTYARCERAVAGYSSVITPFHYLAKPVVMVKTKSRSPLFQWSRLYLQTRSPIWLRVMRQSTRLLLPEQCNWEAIMTATAPPAARQIFYPTNWDAEATKSIMRDALSRIAH